MEDFHPYDLLGFGHPPGLDRQDHAERQEALAILEAFFYATFRDTAVGPANALHVQSSRPTDISPAFEADYPPIFFQGFACVTREVCKAGSAVASPHGKAIAGATVSSLDTMNGSPSMKTAGGVIAKKLVEHGGFCYFQTIRRTERHKEGVNA